MKILAIALLSFTFTSAFSSEVSDKGRALIKKIDALDVEHRWPAGVHVNWETGLPDGLRERSEGKHTHCSAFAAAAAKAVGVYLLRPPEHGQVLLANAQSDWLEGEKGRSFGWARVSDETSAQELANLGHLVIAVYKNPNAAKPGHIAVLRPAVLSTQEMSSHGPEITQAGMLNHRDTTVERGFAGHKGAFKNHRILYFQHSVQD